LALAPENLHPPRQKSFALLYRVLLFVALIGVTVGACSGDEECADVSIDGVCQKPCRDDQCLGGARCVNNACSAPCATHGDCGANRYCVGVQLGETIGNYCVCLGAVVDGVCRQNTCRPEKCPAGWRCIGNACSAPCTTHADCPVGNNCLLAAFPEADGSVTQGTFCANPGFAQDGSIGQDTACAKDDDCDTGRGWRCIESKCRVPCATHPDCGPIGSCSGRGLDAANKTVQFCQDDGKPRGSGQYGTPCPTGEECDDASGFACVGTGAGDLDSYCTNSRCTADADCPTGYECAATRSGRPPCENACGFRGAPDNARCVNPDQIGEGKEFFCGPLSLMRRMCLRKEFCSSCETNADCASIPNQICARDRSGAKICTVQCDPGINSCPWGFAAVCDVWDTELGIPTCAHRFGSCKGTGKSCEPCNDDDDCPNGGLCITTSFTHERFCIDMTASCDECPDTQTCIGNGCPLTPGGLAMTCYGGIPSAEPLFRKCVGANVNQNPLESPQNGCWPAL
jgi:hypothetical protein